MYGYPVYEEIHSQVLPNPFQFICSTSWYKTLWLPFSWPLSQLVLTLRTATNLTTVEHPFSSSMSTHLSVLHCASLSFILYHNIPIYYIDSLWTMCYYSSFLLVPYNLLLITHGFSLFSHCVSPISLQIYQWIRMIHTFLFHLFIFIFFTEHRFLN